MTSGRRGERSDALSASIPPDWLLRPTGHPANGFSTVHFEGSGSVRPNTRRRHPQPWQGPTGLPRTWSQSLELRDADVVVIVLRRIKGIVGAAKAIHDLTDGDDLLEEDRQVLVLVRHGYVRPWS